MDTRVNLSGLWLDNPVIPASGCFGYGEEFARYYDINILGSFSFKGTTKEPRTGNPTPRIAECEAGMINAVGLQNPGIEAVCQQYLPRMKQYFHKPVIANIGGFSVEEFEYCCAMVDQQEQVGLIEVNISCPNLHEGGKNFGSDPHLAAQVTKAVRRVVKNKPLYIKLSPNVTDIAEIALACEAEGADGISLINTLLGMRIDLKTKKPVIANVMGGFSGPAVFPVALRCVWQVAHAVKLPVIGIGGVNSAERVLEMMAAGASAVQVGAANLADPFASKKIIEALPAAMERYGVSSLQDLTAAARGW
ncbi:MAG: dihydroorotate dehydrogenase [Pygmaiobacter massiliensis]|nr:dihydroorotate dehydrogenase [Pygmaiobacter massiliensis]